MHLTVYHIVILLLFFKKISSIKPPFDPNNPRHCHTEPQEHCLYPKEDGSCFGSITRYYYNASTNLCSKFTFKGCAQNRNNFWTEEECLNDCYVNPKGCRTEMPADCRLPLDVGHCFARITKYYYNATTQRCVKFAYSGCGGNANNFWTEKYCYNSCAVP